MSVSLFRDTNATALAEALAQETLANRSPLKRLVEHHASVEEGIRHIDGTLAERGYRGALAADAGRHSDLMDRIRSIGSAAIEMVVRLAHERSPYAELEKKAANRALNTLADASIVIRPAGRGSWALADPLFSAYVRDEIHSA